MGRRKIQIQPITHQRNRMVTFLKRKHGLFKKAYELGVLCSVEVAVIVFEERPNGRVKLHQYCSSDINKVIDRHARYRGDKETLSPSDFTGKYGDLKAFDNEDIDDEADDAGYGRDLNPEVSVPPFRRITKRSHEEDTDTSPTEYTMTQPHTTYSPPLAPRPMTYIPRQPSAALASSSSTSPLSQHEDERATLPQHIHTHNHNHNHDHHDYNTQPTKRQRISVVPPDFSYGLQQQNSPSTNLTSSTPTHSHPSYPSSAFHRAPAPLAGPPIPGGGYPYEAFNFGGPQQNQPAVQNISQRGSYQYNPFMLGPPWR